MSYTIKASDMDVSSSECTGECRLLDISDEATFGHKLQQRWEISQYRSGVIFKRYHEWRDVPIVSSTDHR